MGEKIFENQKPKVWHYSIHWADCGEGRDVNH